MRLGAMLSGSSTGVLEHSALARSGARLVLTLRGPARAFAGEAVEKRLQSLAQRLDCAAEIVTEGLSRPRRREKRPAPAGRFRSSPQTWASANGSCRFASDAARRVLPSAPRGRGQAH